MNKICTYCQYIGKEKRNMKILIFGIALILLGYSILSTVYYPTSKLAVIGSYIWVIFGFYSVYFFYYHPTICKACNKDKTMIPLDSTKAKVIINDNNIEIPENAEFLSLDTDHEALKGICKTCHFIGKGRHSLIIANFYLGLGLAIFGIVIFMSNINLYSELGPIIFLIMVASLIFGITNILNSQKPGPICPKCKKKDMTLLYTEEAQQIIKENDLSIPE